MTSKHGPPLVGTLVALAVATGTFSCGGDGSANSPPGVSVSVSPSAATVQAAASQDFTATVSNDLSNKGVTWTISCSSIPCGSIYPPSTPSGTATTYTPPVTLPAGDLNVTLTATSVADPTKSAAASVKVPQLPGFAGITEAHVDSVNGVTRLIVNGKPAPPLMFMDQQDFPERLHYLAPQVQDAAKDGIHLLQVAVNGWPWDNQGTGPLDFSSISQVMDNVLKADPQALLLIRVDTNPGPGWVPAVAPSAADYTLYPDGQSQNVSIASDIFFNGFLTSVPHLIQYLESSSYGAHILGYLILGQNTGEWFPFDAGRGPDYSPANTQAFRKWLQNKYGTDATLSAAWGMPVKIASAPVPPPQPGRFPIHGIAGTESTDPVYSFYQIPQEQDWVDYSAYTSDIFSQRILDMAQLFRVETGGKRLIGFYNGYLLDLGVSYNGHLRFDRLLASPNIDFFCAALSKFDYLPGGPGGMDNPIETVVAHGKLWFSEEDLETYLAAASPFPLIQGAFPPTADLTQSVDVLQRDLAGALIHRAGTWWMDLSENGAFNDPTMWSPMPDYGIPLYTQLYANPQPYRPDVALIVDRTSITFQKSDSDMSVAQRGMLRTELARSGVAYGVYTLDDFLDGTLPPCKVYLFANTNYLTDNQIAQIQSRLNLEGATAIWQYAPGFLGPNGPDVTRASRLTGIQLSQLDNLGFTVGDGALAGYSWGFTSKNVLSPRLVVNDPTAEALGHYQSDGKISAARKKVGNFESVFIGEFGIFGRCATPSSSCHSGFAPEPLRVILQTTGVHIWSTAGDTVHTDGNLLVIHAAAAGPDAISLPAGVTATPLGGGTSTSGTLNVNFARIGQTLWFQLTHAP